MKWRCVITAGGTGGHLFPAQALATMLQKADIDVVCMGSGLHVSPYFAQENYCYKEVAAGKFSKHPLKLLQGLWQMSKGVTQSISYLRSYRPHLVVGFGSYHTAPVLAAARCLKVPIILHEANAQPGKVNRLFSRSALWTGVFFEQASHKLRGASTHVTLPLRQPFIEQGRLSKGEAVAHYGLDPHKKTIVVFGGSQGARRLNEVLLKAAPHFPKHLVQVIHYTGGDAAYTKNVYDKAGLFSFVSSFEKNMARAYAAADLVVCRSGAGTIAELINEAVPALFVPFAYAADDHQQLNAEYVAEHIGAGAILTEKELSPDTLVEKISVLMQESSLEKMRRNVSSYQKNNPRIDFCQAIIQAIRNQTV